MKNDSIKTQNKKLPFVLKIITSIYGLLYLIFIIDIFIPSKDEPPADILWMVIVNLLFIVFLFGCFMFLWKNKWVGGLIFLIWYLGMCYLGLFVATTDKGVSLVLGFPMLIVAIIIIVSLYKNRNISFSSFSNKTDDNITDDK